MCSKKKQKAAKQPSNPVNLYKCSHCPKGDGRFRPPAQLLKNKCLWCPELCNFFESKLFMVFGFLSILLVAMAIVYNLAACRCAEERAEEEELARQHEQRLMKMCRERAQQKSAKC